ncbi:sigma-70 family RNA polymerase sigma factor [Lignipirellula cremea]|uniref:ECF RNA polymerase sigma factor SigD n=1 Tax=Lignipirellula cremea TaxID=2528010 RepID=A0A518DZE9_9BACT|nr:sigma-70 family RNA polymerase sigma factor [Lignipirellula cremea]QDU97209.1 ECF RNA polymerase sigma factor SigD [Lignipirellula cremea]
MNDRREELAERFKAGESDAAAEYIELVRYQLMAFIEKQLGAKLRKKVEPEDIFQEVSVDAVRSLESVDLATRDPFSWLCQLAERRIIDAHRHFFDAQKRDADREVGLGQGGRGDNSQAGGLINMLIASMTTPSKAFSRNIREARLVAALEELPVDQREVLRLRYVDNLPSKQIAEQVGKSDAAVRVMLTRSLKKLQTILGAE